MYEKKIKNVLNKFDSKEAEKVLDLISESEDKGYLLTKEENKLRDKLWNCLEAYERTMYYIERS